MTHDHRFSANTTCTDVDLRCHGIAGLGTDGSKLDQILSLLKSKANRKTSPIFNVGSPEADPILLDLEFLQEDGNKAYPVVLPADVPECSSCDCSQFLSEDNGTPRLLKHHQEQLNQLGVRFDRSYLRYMMFRPEEISICYYHRVRCTVEGWMGL